MAAETKTRRWWAPIGAGALLCLGCCLAPLLITAGVFAGSPVLVGLSWPEPLGFSLIGLGAARADLVAAAHTVPGCTSIGGGSGDSCAVDASFPVSPASTADDHRSLFAAAMSVPASNFQHYLQTAGAEPYRDNVSYIQLPVWLTDDERAHLMARLESLRVGRLELAGGRPP